MAVAKNAFHEKHDLKNIDFLRIIASLGVVIYHYAEYLDLRYFPMATLSNLTPFRLWVDLFFVISGFVIAYVYADAVGSNFKYGRFLQRRVARLFPLHVVTLLFYVILGLTTLYGIKANSTDKFDWSCLIPNLLLLHATGICRAVSFNSPSWSISAEMGMYIVFPVIAYIARPYRGCVLAVAAFVCIALLELWSIFPGQQYWLFRASQGGLLRALPSFAFGIVLFKNRDLLHKIPRSPQAYILFLCLFIGLCFSKVPYLILLSIVYIVVALCIACDVQNCVPALFRRYSDAGKLTYSIYLLHLPVASVMMTGGKRLLHLHGQFLNLWVMVTFITMISTSWISYHYFEMPTRRWISRLGVKCFPANPSERRPA